MLQGRNMNQIDKVQYHIYSSCTWLSEEKLSALNPVLFSSYSNRLLEGSNIKISEGSARIITKKISKKHPVKHCRYLSSEGFLDSFNSHSGESNDKLKDVVDASFSDKKGHIKRKEVGKLDIHAELKEQVLSRYNTNVTNEVQTNMKTGSRTYVDASHNNPSNEKQTNILVIPSNVSYTHEKPFTFIDHKKKHSTIHHLNHSNHYSDEQLVLNSELLSDIETYTIEKPYTCNICKKRFQRNSNYTTHMRTHTIALKPYQCHLCSSHFKTNLHLITHLRTHNENSYEARCGDKHNIGNNNVKIFMKNNVQETIGNSKNKTLNFSLNSKLITSMGTQNPKNCYKIYNDKFDRNDATHSLTRLSGANHGRNLNTNVSILTSPKIPTSKRPYKCDYCPKEFERNSNFISHMLTHRDKTFNKLKHYSSTTNCHVSERALPNNFQSYQCQYCNKVFQDKFILKVHVSTHERTSTVEKHYKCKYCDKQFNRNGSFIAHMRTHML